MREETRKRLDYTLATFAIEGLYPRQEDIDLCILMDEGKISLDDALNKVKRKYCTNGDKRV